MPCRKRGLSALTLSASMAAGVPDAVANTTVRFRTKFHGEVRGRLTECLVEYKLPKHGWQQVRCVNDAVCKELQKEYKRSGGRCPRTVLLWKVEGTVIWFEVTVIWFVFTGRSGSHKLQKKFRMNRKEAPQNTNAAVEQDSESELDPQMFHPSAPGLRHRRGSASGHGKGVDQRVMTYELHEHPPSTIN